MKSWGAADVVLCLCRGTYSACVRLGLSGKLFGTLHGCGEGHGIPATSPSPPSASGPACGTGPLCPPQAPTCQSARGHSASGSAPGLTPALSLPSGAQPHVASSLPRTCHSLIPPLPPELPARREELLWGPPAGGHMPGWGCEKGAAVLPRGAPVAEPPRSWHLGHIAERNSLLHFEASLRDGSRGGAAGSGGSHSRGGGRQDRRG